MNENAIHVAFSMGRTIALHLFDRGILHPAMTQIFPFCIKHMRSFSLQSAMPLCVLSSRLSE